MNIDEKIKQELERENAEIDDILNEKQGLFELFTGSLKGGLGAWVIFGNIIVLLITIVMFWCGYRFFVAETTNELIFWGVCLVISALPQIAMKQWLWQEMNRGSLMRELKRLEVEVVRLDRKIDSLKEK